MLFRRLEAAASYTLQGVLEKIAISSCVNHCNPSLTAAKMDMDAAFRENSNLYLTYTNPVSVSSSDVILQRPSQYLPPPPPE